MNIRDVENLAELAKINLTSDEKTQILKDMEEILEYVKVIKSVEVKDFKTEDRNKNVWRKDEIRPPFFYKELIIKQFPDSQDGFLKVKKIL